MIPRTGAAPGGPAPGYSPRRTGRGFRPSSRNVPRNPTPTARATVARSATPTGAASSAGGTSRTKRRTSHAASAPVVGAAEPGHQPEAAVLDGEGARDAASRGAERAEEHGLVEPLRAALGEGLGHHGEAGAEDEERDQPDRDRDAVDHARHPLEDVADRDRRDVREGRRHALLHGAVGAGGNPRRREVRERRPVERPRREDHEEVRAERLPVHLAEAQHLAPPPARPGRRRSGCRRCRRRARAPPPPRPRSTRGPGRRRSTSGRG